MFDLNAKSFLKSAKFGLGMTILVLATACSHEVVQQAPIDTSASTGVESVPDATPTPEPSQALASPLDNGSALDKATPIQGSDSYNNQGKSKSKSHKTASFRHKRMIAKHTGKKSHKKPKSLARRLEKARAEKPVAMIQKPEQKPIDDKELQNAAAAGTVAAQNMQLPPAPPTPAAIGSVGDGNMGNVDMNQVGEGGFFSGLLGYWPYGIFALALGGGLFFATRNAGRTTKSGKRGGIVFNS